MTRGGATGGEPQGAGHPHRAGSTGASTLGPVLCCGSVCPRTLTGGRGRVIRASRVGCGDSDRDGNLASGR